MPSSMGSSQPRDQTGVSCIAGGLFTSWATREAHNTLYLNTNMTDFFLIDWLTKPFNQLYVQALVMYTYVELCLQIIKTVKKKFLI